MRHIWANQDHAATTKRSPKADARLTQRLRRWPSFETALSERSVIAGLRAYTAPYFRPLCSSAQTPQHDVTYR